MVNVLKSKLVLTLHLGFWLLIGLKNGRSQSLIISLPQGEIRFQLIENQKHIIDEVLKLVKSKEGDSVLIENSVKGFLIGLSTAGMPLKLPTNVEIKPTAPHFRGSLTVPIEVMLDGSVELRLDRMFIVHGKPYDEKQVTEIRAEFNQRIKNELKLLLYDEVIDTYFTPLVDSFIDDYGRPNKEKIKRSMNPIVDSLSKKYPNPKLTPEQIKAYESKNGLPTLDGKCIIIGTLISGEDVLDKLAASKIPANHWVGWRRVD
jgi:hypothetical protein